MYKSSLFLYGFLSRFLQNWFCRSDFLRELIFMVPFLRINAPMDTSLLVGKSNEIIGNKIRRIYNEVRNLRDQNW